MSEPDAGGNKTVFRPSPLQALKTGGQPAAPLPPAPPPPPPVAARPVPAAKTVSTNPGGGWRTALIIMFVVVTLLAVGYVVLQLTGRGPDAVAPVKISSIDPSPAYALSPIRRPVS